MDITRQHQLPSAFLRGVFFSLLAIISAAASVIVISPGYDYGPDLHTQPPPSFIIAEKGVRHDFRPLFTKGIPILGPPLHPYTLRVTLMDGPAGMSVSDSGVLEWIPGAELIDANITFTLKFDVFREGAEEFSETQTLNFNVLATLPTMRPRVEGVSYERKPIGGGSSGTIFEGYQPRDQDKKMFRWSLVNPPPGISINETGGISWPDPRGYARDKPYEYTVRIEYETPNGTVSNESVHSVRLLPEPAKNDFTELRPSLPTEYGGMLGFSLAEGDGWLAMGEPSPVFGFALPHVDAGRVRMWRFDAARGRYQESFVIQPGFILGTEAFGASVAISEARDGSPTRMAVGAPDANRLGTYGETKSWVGAVYVYSLDAAGNWQSEGRLDPPVEKSHLRFGGWVSVSGNTLIASMQGEDSKGQNTGALAVYQNDGSRWIFSETLAAPDPAWGDFFSYPCVTDGEWIAAAANEDDDDGENSGAVHLFQKQGDGFVHRQRIGSPVPQNGALFGERLLLDGPWLFVSAFRENNNTGAVHVFKRNGTQWDYRQTLESPFAEAGSAFGVALAISENVLSVSAPGNLSLLGEFPSDDGDYPWKGITLFLLENDLWKWSRQTTESPDGTPGRKTWGFALAQPSPEITIASEPDFTGYDGSASLPFAGRAFLHRWPARIADPFSVALLLLPLENGLPATAGGDANGNGVSNLLEWMMGHDPGEPTAGFYSLDMRQVSVKDNPGENTLQMMIPELNRGLGHQVSIEGSNDLIQWRKETNAKWEALSYIYFPQSSGSKKGIIAHPVRISKDGSARFYRLKVVSPDR